MSIPFTNHQAQSWTQGSLIQGSPETLLSGVSINTRTLSPGDLFIAIHGPKNDAHSFIDQAIEAGAAAVMVNQDWLVKNPIPEGTDLLSAPDTTQALGALAHGHRSGFSGPLLAITGSNGKTSTKELAYSILSSSQPCLKNEGNLNNEFGLPLTLLQRKAEHRSAVLEMGMNHRGEIQRLVEIAAPDVGVITNVGTAHIEFLGSQDEIALEKGDLVAGLTSNGIAVLNADDSRVLGQRQRVLGRILTFGRHAKADIRPEAIQFHNEGAFSFRLCTPEGHIEVRVQGWAETTIENSLAAAAATLAIGSNLETIKEGLHQFQAIPGRMLCQKMPSGTRILDDTYNANPQSMRSALETLARIKMTGRSIAVLGDMGELGLESSASHSDIGRVTAETGTDFLFTLGEHAEAVGHAAQVAGMPSEHIHAAANHDEIAREIASLAGPEDWILIKGSRSMQMERIIEHLLSGKEV